MTLRRASVLIAIAIGWFQPCAAAQGDMEVFAAPSRALSLRSLDQRGAIYGQARSTAAWHVAQWNNPSRNVPDFAGDIARNESLSVSTGHSPESLTISQSGRLLPCGQAGGALEFDGLAGTNTTGNDPGLPSPANQAVLVQPLSAFRVMRQRLDMRVISAELVPDKVACPMSKSVSLFCIVLDNRFSSSTLFVQFIVYAFNTSPHDIWWARGQKGGRFGFNAILASASGAGGAGTRQHVDMDLLPILTSTIAENDVGMDKDLRHWKVSGAYFGNAVYGSVNIATRWSGYSLTARLAQ